MTSVDIGVEVVLVPLDGSDFSRVAVPIGAELADRLGAELCLFSAVAAEDEAAGREAALATVDVRGMAARREVVVDLDPAGAIHEAVKRRGRAVVCMASHGRGRSAALVGSVATDVVARGHDPLVLVGQFVDETLPGKGILACIDETPASLALLPVAFTWMTLLLEPLRVATVAEPVPDPVKPVPVRRLFGPDGDVDAFLGAAVRPLRDDGHPVETVAIYDPVGPADGVCSYVEERPVTLVVVSSHARTGLARFAFGSVSAAVVHRSRCPVLVVPRPPA